VSILYTCNNNDSNDYDGDDDENFAARQFADDVWSEWDALSNVYVCCLSNDYCGSSDN